MEPHKNANGKMACSVDPKHAALEFESKRYKVRAVYDSIHRTFTLTNYDLDGKVTEVKCYQANTA